MSDAETKSPALGEQGTTNGTRMEIRAMNETTIDKLATALAKAQAQMSPAAKSGTNPHYNSTFSTLNDVWEAIREPLSSNGLSVVQVPTSTPQGTELTTILMHSSGQYIQSTLKLSVSGNGMQPMGSALSYARRYALSSLVGVASDDDDDDGNAADGKEDLRNSRPAVPRPNFNTTPAAVTPAAPKKPARAVTAPRNEAPISEDEAKKLFALSKSRNITPDEMKEIIEAFFGVATSKDLKVWQFKELADRLDSKNFDMGELVSAAYANKTAREAVVP